MGKGVGEKLATSDGQHPRAPEVTAGENSKPEIERVFRLPGVSYRMVQNGAGLLVGAGWGSGRARGKKVNDSIKHPVPQKLRSARNVS